MTEGIKTKRRRKLWGIALGVVLLMALAGALLVWLRRPAPQDLTLVRLLPPNADLYLLADWQALQDHPVVKRLLSNPPGFSREKEYQQFVEEAGFRYQEDLKQLALAKFGSAWVGSARVSLDGPKIRQYLESQSPRQSQEEGRKVFVFGTGRPFRLSLLEEDLVVFTVGEDAEPIRQVLRRYSANSDDSAAEELQQNQDLRHIRVGSHLWAVGRPEKLWRSEEDSPRLGPFEVGKGMLEGSKTLYVSLQGNAAGKLDIQIEDLCDTTASAQRIANLLQALLGILARPSAESHSTEAGFLGLFSEMSVHPVEESVFLQWQLDETVVRWLDESPRENP